MSNQTTNAAKMKRSNIWVDRNQGTTADGRAFGYVGISGVWEYQGWFFTWPRDIASVNTLEEAMAVVASIEPDAEHKSEPQIPRKWVERELKGLLAI
jgi:hypothetical protein